MQYDKDLQSEHRDLFIQAREFLQTFVANEILEFDSKSAKWIAKDALMELQREG